MSSEISMMTSSTHRFDAAIASIESVIRKHSKTFFFATGLLPTPKRQAIRSLYAFCRASDDLVDCGDTQQSDLDNWRAEVNLPSARQKQAILLSWSIVRERYQIDRQYERELLDGIEMDLTFQPYQTWQDLKVYCYRVASTVGLLSMPIIGLARNASFHQASSYAINLGLALQLTNILRDVGEDALRGRVYFPLEDLQRFGLSIQDILNKVYDSRFTALMRFEIERARQLYCDALPGIKLLSASARPAVGAAALLYRAILDEIEAIEYQVHDIRAHTSGWKKIRMLPEIFLRIARLPHLESREKT